MICLFQLGSIGADDFYNQESIFLLLVPLGQEILLPRIEHEQEMLIAVVVGKRYGDPSGNRDALRDFPQAGGVVQVTPERCVIPGGRGL